MLTAIAYRIEVRSRSLQVGQANGSPIGTILEPRVALQHGHVFGLWVRFPARPRWHCHALDPAPGAIRDSC
jgi:hypothetical protein